jgi:hypothetical protein
MGYSIEVIMRVYDDNTGDYFQISQDSDGLGLVQLGAYTGKVEEIASFAMTLECARKFHQALGEYLVSENSRQPEKDDDDTSGERLSGDY